MKAAVFEATRKPLVVKDLPDPTCAPNGAIIQVEANGICRSDWHAWSGDWTWLGLAAQPGAVLGHEFCGVVAEVGKEVKNFKKGDRVVVPFSQGDGTCEYCRNGQSNVCLTPMLPGFSYPGGFGRLVGIPFADLNLVALPPSIDFIAAASMGCRFMTSFHGIVDRAEVKPGEWVAVYGCGGIGLSAINVAAAMGANVIGIDLDSAKLELAKGLGATHVINGAKTEPVGAVLDLSKGGVHVAVDALGVAATCRNSVMSLRKQGRHLQIGLTTKAEGGEVSMPIDRIVTMELELIGSVGMQASHYPQMLAMVESGKCTPKKMVTGTCDLKGINKIFEEMNTFQNVGVTVINNYN
ncbi:MAG TPA: zinc-dependent alcohol dehydrogenase family protein [Candidatus Binataceae bacterium]|nr:zinc-dependent alcohol dehydrogenase family protein [Candidatus Binataceae bacterium]